MNVQEFNIQSREIFTNQNSTSPMRQLDQSHPGQKKKTFNNRKETLKEVRRSNSRVRDEHRKNLERISKINDSVKYSPKKSAMEGKELLRKSIDSYDGEAIVQACANGEIEMSTQKKNTTTLGSCGKESVSQSMTLNQADLQGKDKYTGSKKMSRV